MKKISKLELLNKDESFILISSINTLYTDLRRRRENNDNLTYLKCKNTYLKILNFVIYVDAH